MENNEKYDFCIVITTYEREDMLKQLLEDIFKYTEYKMYVVVFDDGSKRTYDLSKYDVKYIKYVKNNGLKNLWRVINDAFKFIGKIDAKYYFYLQDDLRLKENFFEESIRIFEKIDDDKKICLELRTDQRTTRPNWTAIEPKIIDEYIHTQWVELDFICKYNFFEALNFKINPIPMSRWDKNPHISSGVGQQISVRLSEKGLNMYHVINTLTTHGDHESVLLPELRKNEKLLAI
jgi:glycosyltransferase involved in cell wall biosynthesis